MRDGIASLSYLGWVVMDIDTHMTKRQRRVAIGK